jgi:hypothetical protein
MTMTAFEKRLASLEQAYKAEQQPDKVLQVTFIGKDGEIVGYGPRFKLRFKETDSATGRKKR